MSESTAPPAGIYVPAVIFFKPGADEELDMDATKTHVLRLARGGVTGILVQGSNGEAQHLSHVERSLLIRTTRQTLDQNGFQNVVVMAGTGAQSTKETKELCEEAHEAGATYALVLTPSTWFAAMNKENIIRFFTEVADASSIPMLIYNFPTVTAGIDLDSTIISTLASHHNIVGTKLSCGSVAKIHRLSTTFSQTSFAVFAGRADVLLPGLMMGSAGSIAALVNLAPKVHVKCYNLWREKKWDEAMKIQEVLSHADWEIGRNGGTTVLKGIVSREYGYGSGALRGPLSQKNVDGELDKWVKRLIDMETEITL